MNDTATKPQATLGTATKQLLFLATTLPCLARKMNVSIVAVEGEQPQLLNYHRNVPWLEESYGLLEFNPDKFHRCIGPWSTGEIYCALFLLNVWNPSYARDKRWRFDLFNFVGTCGGGEEVDAVIAWMKNPIWP
jgi:hypothetical protein